MVLTELNLYHMAHMKNYCLLMLYEPKDALSLKYVEQRLRHIAPGDYQVLKWCDPQNVAFESGFRIHMSWNNLEDVAAWILQNS